MPGKNIEEAVREWRGRIGEEHVVTEASALRDAETATFATTQRVLAIVRPGSRDEVRDCLRIATRHDVRLHPISRGRNWGYGSRVPPEDGVLLDLGRLNRILEFSESLAYVVIEPGVSFGQLAEFLRSTSLASPAIGAGPDASVVGNLLQRGIGRGGYEDMAGQLLGLEALLYDGRVVSTQPEGQGWRTRMPGPDLAGLFFQSELGVVTRATIALSPHKPLFQIGTAAGEIGNLIDGIGAIRRRYSEGFGFQVINRGRLLSEGKPLPPEGFDWFAAAFLTAEEEEELNWRRRTVERHLPNIVWQSPTAGEGSDQQDGMQSAYWAKGTGVPESPDPDRDRCGVVWFTPVLPMDGGIVRRMLGEVDRITSQHGFAPSTSLRFLDSRSVHIVLGLLYDREVSGRDEEAVRCHRALRETFDREGFYPYRFSLLDREIEMPSAWDTGSVIEDLRHFFGGKSR